MALRARLEKTCRLLKGYGPTGHWRFQRLTALALVPLSIWLLRLLDKALHAPYGETLAWLKSPVNGSAIVFWALLAAYHAALGVQVVLEDYVSAPAFRRKAVFASHLAFAGLGGIAVLSIFNIILAG